MLNKFVTNIAVDLSKTPCVNPVLRPRELTVVPPLTEGEAVAAVAQSAWSIWLQKNRNAITSSLNAQVYTREVCRNPACQMQNREIASYKQPLFFNLEICQHEELYKPAILELLILRQDLNRHSFEPRRILIQGSKKYKLSSLR